MGRLNSFIKFVVFNVNALLFLGGIGMIVVASLVLTADFIKLAQNYMQTRGIVLVFVGVFVAGMSVIGCVGTHRQIKRDRLWSGRRILSLYQLILVTVVVGQGLLQMRLYSIEVSLEEAATELPDEHGEFEGRFRDGFNEAYYNQLCSASAGGDTWVWSLAEDLCPDAISLDACSCSDILDGSGLPLRCSVAETYSARECCPDQDFCARGLEQACPYAACRPGILDVLLSYITPARKYSMFVFVLEGLVLTLTCLLICYNPRDSTEDILIKTGTLVKRHGQLEEGGGEVLEQGGAAAGGGSKPGDPEGASMTADAFKLDRVQPAATAAKRRSAAGLREGVGGYKALGSGTPSLSPLGASNAPVEPLRQFMTPRRNGDKVVFTPDSPPDGGDEGTFEYHNPRTGNGKSASVGPHRSSAAAAAARAVAVGAGAAAAAVAAAAPAAAAGGSEVSRTAGGGAKAAAAAGTVAAAGALVGMVAVGASSQRREGEEKTGQDDGDDDGEEEKKETLLSVRQMEYDEEEAGEEGDDNHSFYDGLGAQTPVAEYGDHRFEAAGEEPVAPTPAATLVKTGSIGPNTFLTDGSSVPDASTSRGFLHAGGGGSYHALPSPISPPLSGGADATIAEQPSRFGEQTSILTSPMATNNRPQLNVAIPATNAAAAFVGDRGEGAEASSTAGVAVPPGPPRLLVQTPIASPTGGSPPSFAEHVATAAPTGSGTEEENSGTLTDSDSALPPAAADEPASNDLEEAASPRSNATQAQAPPTNLSISVDDDETQQPQEDVGGAAPEKRANFLKRFLGQTPVEAHTPVGAQTPIGAQTPVGVADVGFNTPTMSPAQEQQQQQQEPVFGSAAYPGNRGSSFSATVAAEALRLGPPPSDEEPSLFPESAEPPPMPQHAMMSTAGGHSRKFSVQTPVASPPRAEGVYEPTVSLDSQPATSTAAQEAAPPAVEEPTRGLILPQDSSPTPKAENVSSAFERGPQSLMAQTPVPHGNAGLYESTASADTQPTTSPGKDIAATAEETPKAKQGLLGAVEGGPQAVMAQTPVSQGNPVLYESTASSDTQPATSPAAQGGGGGEGGRKGDGAASTDAAASTEPTASEPPSRFARFLLQAQESMSRAQMALSLEPDPPRAASPETSPAHISPLRPDSSAAETSAAAATAAGPPADGSRDKDGKPPEEAAVQGESVVGDGDTGVVSGEHASDEPEPGHE